MSRFVRCLFATTVAIAACSGRDGFDEGAEGPFQSGAPDGGGGCEGQVLCSRDLRAVVDACDESRILTPCAPEEGCAAGKCVPACSATAASSASIGCEFAAVPPARTSTTDGSCFAVFVTNTWATPATIEAEHAGAPLDLSTAARVVRSDSSGVTYEPFHGKLEPGQAAVVFLAQSAARNGEFWIGCPEGITPAVLGATGVRGTGRAASFRIKASAPVSAYSMYPFGGAESHFPSATLLLPVPAWKTGYIVTNAWELKTGTSAPDDHPTTQILAAEDGTDVTVVGSVHIQAGTDVEGAAQGTAHTYRLKRGEVLQFVQTQELTGSRISANKNVAVFGGHECMFIPSALYACDAAQLQLFPVQSWGREYVAVPYLSRRPRDIPEDYIYRIIAAANGTNLRYEPEAPEGAPSTLETGAAVIFSSRLPFVVASQDAEHPIALYAYMSGYESVQAERYDGDPEFTSVIAAEQYLGRYVFYVDPTYANSQLVIVRARAPGKDFQPVVLDCAGTLDGWTPVGTEGKYEFVRPRLTKQFVNQAIGGKSCGPGRHEITSEGPIGVTVWGTDNTASYAYPGGAALRTLNTIDPVLR